MNHKGKTFLVVLGMSLFLMGCTATNDLNTHINAQGRYNEYMPKTMATVSKTRDAPQQEDVEEIIEESIEEPIITTSPPVPVPEPAPAPQPAPVYEIPITSRNASEFNASYGETVASINIPSIGLYAPVTYGDSQENINNYDIVIRPMARFDSNSAVILGGHNYKSFSKLFNIHIGDIIQVHSYYGDFTFEVDSIVHGNTDADGSNIYDSNGVEVIDRYSYTNRLYLYTCDYNGASSRFIVTAHPI